MTNFTIPQHRHSRAVPGSPMSTITTITSMGSKTLTTLEIPHPKISQFSSVLQTVTVTRLPSTRTIKLVTVWTLISPTTICLSDQWTLQNGDTKMTTPTPNTTMVTIFTMKIFLQTSIGLTVARSFTMNPAFMVSLMIGGTP